MEFKRPSIIPRTKKRTHSLSRQGSNDPTQFLKSLRSYKYSPILKKRTRTKSFSAFKDPKLQQYLQFTKQVLQNNPSNQQTPQIQRFKAQLQDLPQSSHKQIYNQHFLNQLLEGYSDTLKNQLFQYSKIPKKPYFLQLEDSFVKQLSKLTAKRLMELKKVVFYNQDMRALILSFMLTVCQIDPAASFAQNAKIYTPHLNDQFRQYLSNPGNIIQTIRKIPQSLKSKSISGQNLKTAQEFFNKINSNLLPVEAVPLYQVTSYIIKLSKVNRPQRRKKVVKKGKNPPQESLQSYGNSVSDIENQDLSAELLKELHQSIPDFKIHCRNSSLAQTQGSSSSRTQRFRAKTKLLGQFLLNQNTQKNPFSLDIFRTGQSNESKITQLQIALQAQLEKFVRNKVIVQKQTEIELEGWKKEFKTRLDRSQVVRGFSEFVMRQQEIFVEQITEEKLKKMIKC